MNAQENQTATATGDPLLDAGINHHRHSLYATICDVF
ncbi:hypothetical protein C7M28_01852 [Bacillus subtilis]|nr:hypothetical protein C7M28_01852 [Bacillus subtilis]